MKIEDIAKICHEANKALCEVQGDFSQAQWAQSPGWQKGSAVAGVQHVIDNPDSTPEDSHKSWLKMKEAEGWTYGETKNPEHKRHPCMLPYEDLPETQKVKDELFLSICSILIPSLEQRTVVKADTAIAPGGPKVDVDKADASAEKHGKQMNDADKEAIGMEDESKAKEKTAKKKKAKTLPSGRAMPVVKK